MKFFLALVVAWMAGAVAAVAAEGDTFTASATTAEDASVNVTYKVLTEPDGDTFGTVQVGANSVVAIPTNTSGTLIIPETVTREVEGTTYTYTVVRIGDSAFSDCAALTSVVLPSTITVMYSSFRDCTGLQTIDLSNTQITSVWGGLFSGCTNLTSVSLPSTVTEIRYEAFAYCTSLTSIVLPPSLKAIYGGAFKSCTALSSIDIPASVTTITNIGYSGYSSNYGFPFAGCTSLSRVNISDIAAWANMTFYGNAGNPLSASYDAGHETALYMNGEPITDLVIPEGVTTIKKGTFLYNTAIQSVTIPSTVKSIANSSNQNSFYYTENSNNKGCPNLRKVTMNAQSYITNTTKMSAVFGPYVEEFVLPASGPTSIGQYKFQSMSNLTTVNIPSTVTEIGVYAFKETGITSIGPGSNSIELPAGLRYIQSNAFEGCNSLTSVEIPSGLWTINVNAFMNCTNLQSVTLPEPANQYSMTKLETEVFSGCTSLTSISIPEGFTSIGNFAFYGCTSLAEVSLPSTLTSIGNKSFYGCTALDDVTILSASAPSLGTDAFTTNSEEKPKLPLLKVKMGCESSYSNSNYSQYFDQIVGVPMPGQVIYYCGIPYTVHTAPYGNTLGTVGLGSGSSDNPGHSGFSDGEVTVPSTIAYKSGDNLYVFNVTALEPFAFNSSDITRINLPATIEEIRDYAVCCSSLERICVESTNPEIFIYGQAFDLMNQDCKLAVPVGCVDAYRDYAYYEYDSNINAYSVFYFWRDGFSDIIENDDAPVTVEIDGIEWKFTVVDAAAKTLRTYSYYKEAKGDPEVINCIPTGAYDIISIPSTVTYNGEEYTVSEISGNSLKGQYTRLSFSSVYSYCTIPPTLAADAFDALDEGQQRSLFVPAGSLSTYQTSDWAQYFSYIAEIQPGMFISQAEGGVMLAYKIMDGSEPTVQVQRGVDEAQTPTVGQSVTGIFIPETVQHDGVEYVVKSIGASAFQSCTNLAVVIIPNTISTIGEGAFSGCSALSMVAATMIMPPSLPDQAFDPLVAGSERTLYVPYGCYNKYQTSAWGPYFSNIVMINDKDADIVTIEPEPEQEYVTDYSQDMTDGQGNALDLEDAVASGVYYNLKTDYDTGLANGFDADEGCIVINNTTSEEDMNDIVSGDFDRAVMVQKQYMGLVVEVNGKGTVDIVCQTLGTGQLTVRIGDGAPVQYTQDERGTISVDFNVEVPTCIYVYATEMAVSGEVKGYRMMGMRRANGLVSDNSVKIYQLSVMTYPEEVEITISDAGMATFSSKYPLDFTGVEGLKAYIVSVFEPESSSLTLTRLEKTPAKTGLLLKGIPGTYTVPVVDYTAGAANLLVPILSDITLQPTETIHGTDYTNFVLTRYEGNVGFYRFVQAQSYTAGKAYLQIATELVTEANANAQQGVKGFVLNFDDEDIATAIAEMEDDESALEDGRSKTADVSIYNLAGQRVSKAQKGLYIVNGKKAVVK